MKDSEYDLLELNRRVVLSEKCNFMQKSPKFQVLKACSHISEPWDPMCSAFESRICTDMSFRSRNSMGESRDPEGQKAQTSCRNLLLENQGDSKRNKIEEKN